MTDQTAPVDLPLVGFPFNHSIVDDLWPDTLLDQVAGEFPDPESPRWRRFHNQHESKLGSDPSMYGTATCDLLSRIAGLSPQLSSLYGIPDLTMETVGGGMHLIPPGGHLDVHVDFSVSPVTGLYRRLNVIVFLNRDWDDPGGWLELRWPPGHDDAHPVLVAPEHNRTVVFATSDRSWHGHPEPTRHRWRRSVAAYFYSSEPPAGFAGDHSTIWAT